MEPPVATRFKPGQSGNPGGKPKGLSLVAILNDFLLRDPTKPKVGRPRKRVQGNTNAEIIVRKLIEIASQGDRQAIKDIFDRIHGKVPDKLNVTSSLPTVEDLAASLTAVEHRYDREHPDEFERNHHQGNGALSGPAGEVQPDHPEP
jgi:hypothetical protein